MRGVKNCGAGELVGFPRGWRLVGLGNWVKETKQNAAICTYLLLLGVEMSQLCVKRVIITGENLACKLLNQKFKIDQVSHVAI